MNDVIDDLRVDGRGRNACSCIYSGGGTLSGWERRELSCVCVVRRKEDTFILDAMPFGTVSEPVTEHFPRLLSVAKQVS